jgi:CrcB protein
MNPELAVALGAAVGAPSRYAVDRLLPRPWGTLSVNLLGSGLAGLVLGLAPRGATATLLLVGLLGAFTTASTLAWDVLERGVAAGGRLLLLHLLPGLALAGVGLAAGRAL